MLIGGFTRFYVESPSISLQAYVSDVFHQKPDFLTINSTPNIIEKARVDGQIGKIGAET